MKRLDRLIKVKMFLAAIMLGFSTTVLCAWGNIFKWWDWEYTRSESEGVYTVFPGCLLYIETASELGTTWYCTYARKEWRHFRSNKNNDNNTFIREHPLIFPPTWVTDRISHRYPVVTICARGFPARAFVSVAYGNISIPDRWSDFEMSRNYSSESIDFMMGNTQFVLPTTPLWGGLCFDILFWSCIWYFTLPRLPRPIKLILARMEQKRMQRGLCPNCDYDLKRDFQAGCPECEWNRNESDNESTLK